LEGHIIARDQRALSGHLPGNAFRAALDQRFLRRAFSLALSVFIAVGSQFLQ
jgi:hypothetical protein